MTKDEIIEFGKQAGLEAFNYPELITEDAWEKIEAFAKLVAEKERDRISQKIAQLPFGDTAQSLSIWVKNDT
jgi:hypothetical protein